MLDALLLEVWRNRDRGPGERRNRPGEQRRMGPWDEDQKWRLPAKSAIQDLREGSDTRYATQAKQVAAERQAEDAWTFKHLVLAHWHGVTLTPEPTGTGSMSYSIESRALGLLFAQIRNHPEQHIWPAWRAIWDARF